LQASFAASFASSASGTGVTGLRSDAFIYRAVTVVVFAIADLGCGLGFASTGSPCTAGAGLCTFFAKTFAGSTSRTGITGTAQVGVGLAVTVVVFAIAIGFFGFVSGIVSDVFSATTVKPSTLSGTFLFCTFADTILFGAIGGLQIVINFAVTIVVFAIADLFARRFGLSITLHRGPIGGTHPLARRLAFALAFAASLTLGAEGFVNFSIAVVVFAVADLSFRQSLTETLAPGSRLTGLCSFFASSYTGTTGARVTIFALTAFISLTIAIVIFAIAGFFCRKCVSYTSGPL
jgi:hypothetical protein